jgi:hypothetical protein
VGHDGGKGRNGFLSQVGTVAQSDRAPDRVPGVAGSNPVSTGVLIFISREASGKMLYLSLERTADTVIPNGLTARKSQP